MNIKILFLNFILNTILLVTVFNIVLSLPLRASVLFATTISLFIDLAYILHKKGILKRREIKAQEYWPKLALKEFVVVIFSITVPLYLGIDTLKALGIGSFFLVIAEIYYTSLPNLISFSHTTLTIRRILCFLSVTLGWYSLVELNFVSSILAGFVTFSLIESDREVTKRLYELNMLSEEDLRKSAGRILMIPGLVLGMAAGWMIGKGVFEIETWKDWLPQLFKFYPVIILLFYSVFQPINWLRVYLHERRFGGCG